jgi:hypothetical protein
MADKKTIHLNSDFFNLRKTRKKRPNLNDADESGTGNPAAKRTPPPITMSPLLKQKMLERRLRENKLQQLQKQFNRPKLATTNTTTKPALGGNAQPALNDDFNDSMNYLQTLKSFNSVEHEKQSYLKNKQRKQEDLHKRTLHNPYRLRNHVEPPAPSTFDDFNINLDLPPELLAENGTMLRPFGTNATESGDTSHFNNLALSSVVPSYNVDKAVPYGILRNGIKPTYRDWIKNSGTPASTSTSTFASPSASSFNMGVGVGTSTDNTLTPRQLAQQKIRYLREQLYNRQSLAAETTAATATGTQPPTTPTTLQPGETPIKKVTKTTYTHKYTLGRSKVKKSIAVLIKNSTIRNKIIDAHNELKTHSIPDIKRFLREHNLIKIGTNAPNDVLRQLYENSILTGDVVNTNGSVLLHNFTKSNMEDVFMDTMPPPE